MNKTLLTAVLLLSILVLSAYAVSAQIFSVKASPITTSIKQNGVASFKITVTNGPEFNHVRIVPVNDPSKWSFVYTDPDYVYLSGMNLQPNETKSFILYVKTRFDSSTQISPGSYTILLTFKSDSGVTVQKILPQIEVLPFVPTIKDYTSAITLNVKSPDTIDPRKISSLKILISNRANFPLIALKLNVESPLFNKSRIVSVDSKSQGEVDFSINLSPRIKPQSGLFKVKLYTPSNQLILEKDIPYSVLAYSQFTHNEEIEKGFLKRTVILKIRNIGNTKGTTKVTYPVGLATKIFTHYSGANYEKINSRHFLVWTLTLKPNEQKVLIVRENFVPIFIAVILAIVLYLLYYFFIRNPIIVKKEARIVKLKEGGTSELKVFIHIKNRSAKVFDNVILMDKLPKIAEIDKTIETGTLKPSKIIRHSVKGTVIKWEIGTLDKFEERIINYTIKSKLSILGWFKLPAAAVKFKHGSTFFITKSNSVRLEVPKPEEK